MRIIHDNSNHLILSARDLEGVAESSPLFLLDLSISIRISCGESLNDIVGSELNSLLTEDCSDLGLAQVSIVVGVGSFESVDQSGLLVSSSHLELLILPDNSYKISKSKS